MIFSLKDYAFLAHEQAPDTVNPSLWRQARLNMNNGLFQVTDRIYQVRGFDISNMTIIEGSRGLIVIDPLVSTEVARARRSNSTGAHRGRKPVTAVIYTHSHVDHFGGVRGVVDEADVKAGNVAIIAPDRFMEEVTKENVLVGTPMIRRAMFQFGAMLPKGPRGQVDAGLGKVISRGTVTLIPPTQIIRQPIETHVVDGVEIIFQLAPETEAPAEMHMFYPGLQGAEPRRERHPQPAQHLSDPRRAGARCQRLGQVSQRGARQLRHQVRRGVRPASLAGVGQRAPARLPRQAARHLQVPARPDAAADEPRLQGRPRSPSGWRCRRAWSSEWHVRGYYGTFSHNAKAVYQRYLGWYDANPANLNPLPPVERAKKTVDYMGGADAVIARAREDFAKGEYRWVADAMSQVVFAEPDNTAARELAPMPWSRSAIRPSPPPGATPTCSARRSCGAA